MQNAIDLMRYTLPNISLHKGADLISAGLDFIEGYREQFGETDGFATFYVAELKHLYLKEKMKYDN